MSETLAVGHHYFVSQSRRTDEFRGKRYTTPSLERWERLIVRGRLVEQRGAEVKLHLDGNNGFERDGAAYVFSTGQLLFAKTGEHRSQEQHGMPDVTLGAWQATG